jgi:hypothetical protein
MPNVKCIWIFQSDEGYGWTEVHYLTFTGQPNLNAVITTMDTQITPVRTPLLGQDCALVGYRASFPTLGGIASLPARVFPDLTGTPGQNSASQNDSFAQLMLDSTFTRKKIIHLRGIWDSAVQAQEVAFPAAGLTNYKKLLLAYTTALTTKGFGWLGKNPTASVFGTVTGYSQNTTDNVTFTVQPGPGSAALASLIAAGMPATYDVRFSKLNYSKSVLNRTFVCTPTPAGGPVTGLTTVQPVATGPFISGGRFNITIPQFIAYANIGQVSLGERRMGKALSLYPGRGRRKPVI